MLYFNRNGVWFTIPIAKDAVYSRELLEKQIHNSLLGLQKLKDRSPDLDQMRFEKPGEYVIKSVFGRDDILIIPSKIVKGKPKKIVEPLMYEQIVPYLQCPDGILLCMGGLNFNGPYVFKDFYNKGHYDGTLAYNDYYAPYKTPNDGFTSYSYDPPDPLAEGENLILWQIKDIVEDLEEIKYTYNEPNWYGPYSWCPAYWENWEAWNAAYVASVETGDELPTDTYGLSSDLVTTIDEPGASTTLNTVSWGWGFLPNIYNYRYYHEQEASTASLSAFGTPFITDSNYYLRNSYSSDGNYGGEIFERWHTMLYPAPGGCPEDPSVTYWEDCPSVDEFPFGSYQSISDTTSTQVTYNWLARVSDLNSRWAVIYKRWARTYTESTRFDYDAYYGTSAGTLFSDEYKHYVTYDDTVSWSVEIRYLDSSGVDILLDSGTDEYFGYRATGSCRFYPDVNGKDIFVFGYDRDWSIPGEYSCAGISSNGNATITNLDNDIVAGDRTFSMIQGRQFSGILKMKTDIKNFREETIEE